MEWIIKSTKWTSGGKTPYLAFAKTLKLIEDTSGRNDKIELLTSFLSNVIKLSKDDLSPSIHMFAGQLGPSYDKLELGIASNFIHNVICETYGKTLDTVKSDLKAKGDIGLVAMEYKYFNRKTDKSSGITVEHVYEKLNEVAQISGKDVRLLILKSKIVKALLERCQGIEIRYFVRFLSGKLRVNLAENSILVSLANAFTLIEMENGKKLSDAALKKKMAQDALILKTTFCECPNYQRIIECIFDGGIEELPNNCKLTPGIPLKPMLAHPAKGIDEIFKRFTNCEFVCEWKYDGERCQIHKTEKGVKIFSRNQEDNTSKYPDVIGKLNKCFDKKIKDFICDGEVVAWDPVTKSILPFQTLCTRKRKNASDSEIKVTVCVFFFDLLYFNGDPLVTKTYRERRTLLHGNFNEVQGVFHFATAKDTTDIDEIGVFLDESIVGKCEGLMIKTLDTNATYEIAKRSHNWLKLKKDYINGIGDTVDLVVMGAYFGEGKRTGLYGGYLLGCYDKNKDQYQTICKIGTGFKDEDLKDQYEYLNKIILKRAPSYYVFNSSLKPDVWFQAKYVWEVKAADLSISPLHLAAVGLVDKSKGISLRFPRYLNLREDKKPRDATDSTQISSLYSNQAQLANNDVKDEEDDEDED
uniref:DNA ligase n=1 Tax=Rhabditophanes sp. KR3021 TaxID=114890 RepID=A0AC35UGJ0_9BILA